MNDLRLNDSKKVAEKCTINAAKKHSISLTRQSLLEGIIISEIIGPPKGRKGLMYNVHKSINSR